ncbi:MAG: hypothetical protein D6812_17995 [Deltaproteobacteria bacterium]|nr:MAG: hypothetical protein D6812_17995 [Deltaproteobacteria bacterium]
MPSRFKPNRKIAETLPANFQRSDGIVNCIVKRAYDAIIFVIMCRAIASRFPGRPAIPWPFGIGRLLT